MKMTRKNDFKPPESYVTALKIINKDHDIKRRARNVITEQVNRLKYNPYKTIK
jgi:hypothetical protein